MKEIKRDIVLAQLLSKPLSEKSKLVLSIVDNIFDSIKLKKVTVENINNIYFYKENDGILIHYMVINDLGNFGYNPIIQDIIRANMSYFVYKEINGFKLVEDLMLQEAKKQIKGKIKIKDKYNIFILRNNNK